MIALTRVFINQEQKLGTRRRSNTVLVSTIDDPDPGPMDVASRTLLALYEKSKFVGYAGSMVSRLTLKGIGGRPPPPQEWSMQLNLTRDRETYQVQT